MTNPAIDEYGTKWWVNSMGQFHREGGPALEYIDGSKRWYINGELHREDGPAVDWTDGYKAWYINGLQHREDGPAVELANGEKEWWINGTQVNVNNIEIFDKKEKSEPLPLRKPSLIFDKTI
jgi:hypothetical protein